MDDKTKYSLYLDFFRSRKVELKQVNPSRLEKDVPIGLLAYGTDEQKKAYSLFVVGLTEVPVEFPPEPMLVFAGFTDRRLTAILSELREKGLSDISLKAVLTEYNAIWNSATLYSQRAEERAQFLKGY